MRDALKKKIADNSALVGVIGLGYVGLPLVQHLCAAGYTVIGFDVDPEKVKQLETGHSYIGHIPSEDIADLVGSGRFEATAEFTRLDEPDVIIICVPTPLSRNYEPDLQYVQSTGEAIQKCLRKEQLVILESTTYPGTTTEVLQPLFEATGHQAGRDFYLAFSPEREDPGNKSYTIKTIPKVIGGVTEKCAANATALYEKIFERVVPVSSPATAELTKLLENIFRSVNIALVNELKMLCDRMGIDIWEVIDAAATKPFGYMPFYPGPGLGGHCIPIDPFYLTWKAREYDFSTKFIELAGQINTAMPAYVISRLMEALNERSKTLKNARILVLGVAYKKDVDDVRESPSFKLIELLFRHGAWVDYNDPHVPTLPHGRKYQMDLTSVPLTAENLAHYDAVLISTAHSQYDFDFIVAHAPLVVDTRNATKGVTKGCEKIIKA